MGRAASAGPQFKPLSALALTPDRHPEGTRPSALGEGSVDVGRSGHWLRFSTATAPSYSALEEGMRDQRRQASAAEAKPKRGTPMARAS
jgi:hypothetical protein